MKRRILHLVCLLAVAAAAFAQGPNDTGTYYKKAHGKHGEALKTAFFEIIKNPSVLTYADLWTAYNTSDVHEVDGQVLIWDIYSNITAYTPDSPHKNNYEGSGLNREHSFPKSWFNEVKPAYSDLVHVIPTDGYINNMRSDLPYGETDNPFKGSKMEPGVDGPPYYSKVGKCSVGGYTKNIFEPADEWKGDLARIYFYMATCYEQQMPGWISLGKTDMLGGNAYQPFASWCFPMLLQWAANDPVSEKEQLRNDAIWLLQGNRNPFVDYPGLEDYIWGDLSEVDFGYDGTATEIEPVVATSCDINLNKSTFGVDWSGNSMKNTRDYWERYPLTIEKNGITVAYNYGIEGQNMYANDTQIRMYKYNTLTFTTEANDMTSIVFTVIKNDANKEFFPSTGTMEEPYKWTGNAREVSFTVTEGNGNVQISKVHVEVGDVPDGIEQSLEGSENVPEAIYGIDGRKYDTLQPGLNIIRMKNGTVKKVVVY